MSKNWETLTEEEKKQIREQISLQNYLSEWADMEYMCYWLKISFSEFWDRYVWKKLDNSPSSLKSSEKAY
jgi:hypothetical protein